MISAVKKQLDFRFMLNFLNIFAHKNHCINCETAYVSNTLS